MSSILKALKKLEAEKRQSAVPADRVSRDDRGSVADIRRPQKNLWLLGVGMLVGLAAAGGWIYWAGNSPEKAPTGQDLVQNASGPPAGGSLQQPEGDAAVDKSARVVLPQGAGNAVDSAGEGNPAGTAVIAAEAEDLALVLTSSGPKSAMSEPTAKTSGSDPGNQIAPIVKEKQADPPAVVVEVRVPPAEPVSAKTPEATAATDGKAPVAGLSLRSDSQPDTARTESSPPPAPATVSASTGSTGIPESRSPAAGSTATAPSSAPFQVMEVFYQAGEGSMAVVDDLPVMEGTIINGARVEKIFPDRVRFIIDGRPVEVFAGQSQP